MDNPMTPDKRVTWTVVQYGALRSAHFLKLYCHKTSSENKCSRTYGVAVAIGGASAGCVLFAPVVACFGAAGADDVGLTGVCFFAGCDFAAAVFAIFGTGFSSESSASAMSTAEAADVLLDDAPPALLFLDVDAAAISWSSSASMICTSAAPHFPAAWLLSA
jgi:hypothetical protein